MCKPVVTSRVQLRPLASLQGASPSGGARTNPPCQRCFATRRRVDGCAPRAIDLYQQALVLAREEDYQAARGMFEEVVTACPHYSKAWVSWAQMEKRVCKCMGETGGQRFLRCREVLQRAMTLNPTDAELTQAWGLMELQRGNIVAAVKLLERCAQQDPRNLPVLKWKPVREAQLSVQSMKGARRSSM